MLSPKDLDLPAKFTGWREGQYQAAVAASSCPDYGFLLEAPTGTGKSLVGAAAQRIRNTPTAYIVETKQLQDQILQDFPYARTLKGRNNYKCLKFPTRFPEITAGECTDTRTNPCEHKGECPYIVAKMMALRAPLAVLNYSYFLHEVNYASEHTEQTFSGRKLAVCDEADAVEDELMSFISLVITQKQLDRLHLDPPQYKTKFESWVEWAKPAERQIVGELAGIEREIRSITSWSPVDMRILRRHSEYTRLRSKLQFFIREVDQNWVWYPGEDEWVFKPVWVAKYAYAALWKHMEKVIGMSATILDPKQIDRNIGLTKLPERSYRYLAMGSPFPKENRPVHYEPCANLTNKTMAAELPKLAQAIDRVLAMHADDKVLIHTVSYKVRDFLIKNLSNRNRLLTHATLDRAAKLKEFKASRAPLVLLSPSMDRGVDLPKDECRAVIIAKCVPETTLAVTPEGLRRWDELSVGDRVFALSSKGKVRESRVQRVYHEEYKGPLTRFLGMVQCEVTPDHRVLVHGKGSSSLQYVPATGLTTAGYWCIPYTGKWEGGPVEGRIDVRHLASCPDEGKHQPHVYNLGDFLEFLGWYIAEGHRRITTVERDGYRSWKVVITQRNDKKRRELLDLCDRMSISYVVSREYGKDKNVVISGRLFCEAIGNCAPDGARNKRIPRWALGCSRSLLDRLFSGLMKGDGSMTTGKSWAYITSSLGLCEDFCELCTKTGHGVRVYHRSHVKHEVYVRRQHDFSITGSSTREYEGVVWCPTTEDGNWLACWGGYYFFTGNCPYPDLGDPQIKKRVYASRDGDNWYAHKTVGSIVQMSGRGMRSVDDYATTYILDSQFERLLSRYRQLFPSWFLEAIIT